jgi:hypothetical protein
MIAHPGDFNLKHCFHMAERKLRRVSHGKACFVCPGALSDERPYRVGNKREADRGVIGQRFFSRLSEVVQPQPAFGLLIEIESLASLAGCRSYSFHPSRRAEPILLHWPQCGLSGLGLLGSHLETMVLMSPL